MNAQALNIYALAAGALALFVAAVHSALGEWMIFRRLRQSATTAPLRQPHVQILWASWHVVSVLGCALAAMLLYLGLHTTQEGLASFVTHCIAAAMLASALLVLGATRARHLGWVGLLGVAVLAWWSRV